jgi:O-antigen/teichoic acid export membrane protein
VLKRYSEVAETPRLQSGDYGPIAAAGRVLLGSSGVYVASNLVGRVIPLLLLPVFSRYLDPESFGCIAMYTTALTLIAPIVGFTTEGAIGRQYFERESIDLASYITTCLLFTAASCAAVTLALFFCARALAPYFALPEKWVWTLAPVVAARYPFGVALTLLQAEKRPIAYAALCFGQSLLGAAISLYLIVALHFAWQGRVIGEIAASMVLGAIGLVAVCGRYLAAGRWRTAYLAHALRFGGGLLPHTYGGILISYTDRILITNMVGIADTGRYVIGAQIATLISVLEHSFNQAWAPWLFERLKRRGPGDDILVSRITWIYNVSILALAFALAILAWEFLGTILGQRYANSAHFVFWLSLGNAFNGMYKMVANQIFFANKTYLLSFVTFVVGVVNVVLTYALISAHGSLGAAQASAAALFLSYFLTARISSRVTRVSP